MQSSCNPADLWIAYGRFRCACASVTRVENTRRCGCVPCSLAGLAHTWPIRTLPMQRASIELVTCQKNPCISDVPGSSGPDGLLWKCATRLCTHLCAAARVHARLILLPEASGVLKITATLHLLGIMVVPHQAMSTPSSPASCRYLSASLCATTHSTAACTYVKT
jgi:hypothetical protein